MSMAHLDIGISAKNKASKRSKLGADKGKMKEIVRRAQLLQHQYLLSQIPLGTLRQMADNMEEVIVTDGVYVFHEGDAGDALFLVDHGSVGVYIEGKGKVSEVEQGLCFGELALITHEPRTASVRAQGSTKLLKLNSRSIEPIITRIWGGQKEMAKRMGILERIPIFQYMPRDAMQLLATHLTRVKWEEPGMDMVTEGKMGDCMYVIEVGQPMVWVHKVGRLNELKPGDYFGELALLNHIPRTASCDFLLIFTVLRPFYDRFATVLRPFCD